MQVARRALAALEQAPLPHACRTHRTALCVDCAVLFTLTPLRKLLFAGRGADRAQ